MIVLLCCVLAIGSYREGDIRLVGGPHNWEGRVELFWNGEWGAISDSQWTNTDALIVCRQLQHASESGKILAHFTTIRNTFSMNGVHLWLANAVAWIKN